MNKPVSFFKTISTGIKWSMISQVGRQIINLGFTMILARLLSPSDYGIMGMALVTVGFLELFKDLGSTVAIIQRKELTPQLLSSVFWMNTCFGFVSALLVAGLAVPASLFYQEPKLVEILQVLGLSFAVSGLGIVPNSLLQRNMAFARLAQIELAGALAGGVTGLCLALRDFGVWSLVGQTTISTLTITGLLWHAAEWRPTFTLSPTDIKSVWSYSLYYVGYNVFNYFARNADNIIIGRFLGAHDLGYYALAYRLMLVPLQNVTQVVGRVFYPVFCRIQNDHERFRKLYLRMCEGIAMLTFPLMCGLFVTSATFIPHIFGEQWRPTIPLFMLLAPVGAFQSIASTATLVYLPQAKPDWLFYWSLTAGILLTATFFIAIRWGIVGVAGGYLIMTALLFYPSLAIPVRLINLEMRTLFLAIFRPALCTLIMGIPLYLMNSVWCPHFASATWQLAAMISIGGLTYLLGTYLTNRELVRTLIQTIHPRPA